MTALENKQAVFLFYLQIFELATESRALICQQGGGHADACGSSLGPGALHLLRCWALGTARACRRGSWLLVLLAMLIPQPEQKASLIFFFFFCSCNCSDAFQLSALTHCSGTEPVYLYGSPPHYHTCLRKQLCL